MERHCIQHPKIADGEPSLGCCVKTCTFNRYYDPARGRFTTPDPFKEAGGGIANPLSWNRYAYTRGDPVNFADPSGLEDCPAPCYSATTTEWMLRPGGPGGIGGIRYLTPVLAAEGQFDGDGGGSSVPLCDDLLSGLISGFLNGKNSPLLTQDKNFISDVMTESKLVGVDPRLFIAETAESGWGTSNVATTMNNPFGLKDSSGNSSFDSVGDAISAEGSTLNKYVNKYNFSVSQMYSGLPGLLDRRGWHWVRPPAYCQGAGCVALGNVISDALKTMGGDPSKLKYPSGQVGSTPCN